MILLCSKSLQFSLVCLPSIGAFSTGEHTVGCVQQGPWKLENLNLNLKFQVQVKSGLTIISFKFSSLKLEEPEIFKSSQVWKVTNLNLKFIKIRTSKVRKELHYDQNFQKMWNKKLFFYIHFRNLKLSKGIIKIIKTCPIFLMIFERVWP